MIPEQFRRGEHGRQRRTGWLMFAAVRCRELPERAIRVDGTLAATALAAAVFRAHEVRRTRQVS